MMNIKHLFGLAVIAAMTASCSSSDELAGDAGTGANETTGTGYATFTINLPTTSGSYTRADENPSFDKGDANEYDVNNATLLIFQEAGTSENDYTFVESVELGNMAPWTTVGSDGITTEAKITAELKNVGLDGKYYALVVLNNKDKNGANKITLPSTSAKYSEWNVAAQADGSKFMDNSKGFYMANAPEFTTAGTDPTTLVKVDKIYTTKQEAENSAGTTIHVERGLAKVTVAALPTDKNPTSSKYSSDKVDIKAWGLDVTNTKTFPVHKTATLSTDYSDIWKNVSGNAPVTARFVDGNNTKFKRVYWGVDPNYSTDYTTVEDCKKEFTILDANAPITGDAATPQYCLENTFNITHMMQGQTTRVIFKAEYTPNGFTKGENFYKIGNNTDIWNEDNLVKQIKAKAQEVLSETDEAKIEVDLSAADNNIKGEAGTKILKAANVKHNDTAVSDADIAKINEKLGLKAATETAAIVGIATYKSGETYYVARIKHFGDDLTPWKEGNDTYGNDNSKWLGRYGVLRNNWYELTVNSVSGPGTPDIPTIKPTDPDDENYKYINVSVKILDWAKRTQKVDL